MSKSSTNSIELKSINQLFGLDFFIPDYQRGYRWKEEQVINLLDDIWDFAYPTHTYKKGDNDFYCLQPVVVRKNDNLQLEVIDGQQRLTTIYLILKNLEHIIDGEYKSINSITYQTREDSATYLKTLKEEDKERNIDFHYMFNANEVIVSWFNEKAKSQSNAKVKFLTPFLEETKVIWYEINDGSNAKQIFARLNVGKIPLTNAELIKALFLREQNFNNADKEQIRLLQFRIASEWDAIENVLQNDSFWHFIFQQKRKEREQDYTTRIEFIFDLIENKKSDSEKNYTFNRYYNKLKDDDDIEALWMNIKRYVQTFQNWYQDPYLYHLVGFLVAQEFPIAVLKEKSESLNKTDFKDYLTQEIKAIVKCNLDELEYGHKNIRPILLLFNIETIIRNPNSNIKFPFDSFKKENWDVEHIRSVKSDRPERRDARLVWLKGVIEFVTGREALEEQKRILESDELTEDLKKVGIRIIDLIQKDNIQTKEFDSLFDDVLEIYVESADFEEMNSIANLTLLDSYTNRMYKNAIFPIKRKTIIKHDKEGTFVPICTKNVFLKYYSNKARDMMHWEKADALDYLAAIKKVLKDYYK